MRIIAGQAGGRRLKAPRGVNTRPTSDRVKEAIFNVLFSKVVGSNVLDVFAGTGSLGIEAISRGARKAVFIEKNHQAWHTLQENISQAGFASSTEVYRADYTMVLSQLQDRFEIIFLDPPYNRGYIQPAVSLILQQGLLASGGVLVVETNAKEKEVPDPELIKLVKESVYGDTAILYYQFN